MFMSHKLLTSFDLLDVYDDDDDNNNNNMDFIYEIYSKSWL